jgi:hypothetical protein
MPYALAGKLISADEAEHRIVLRHEGIPGRLPAGNDDFFVAKEARLPVKHPWPGIEIGQTAICKVQQRRGQWVVMEIVFD